MSPWFPFEPPFVIEAHNREDVLFGLKRFRYVASYYAEVRGAASVLRLSPQQVDDQTGQPYQLTDQEVCE